VEPLEMAPVRRAMRKILIMLLVAVVLGTVFSGCLVLGRDGGYWRHRHEEHEEHEDDGR
jgi:hypothetical protein